MIDQKPKLQYLQREKLRLWEEGNARKHEVLTNIEELANNISKIGIRVPLLVKKKSETEYLVFSGQRRLTACNMAKIPYIPCVVFETINAHEARILSLSENLYRHAMSEDDISDAALELLNRLKDRESVARALGMSVSTIKKYLGYRHVPESLKELVRKKKLTPQQAIDIFSKFPNEKSANAVASEMASIKTKNKKAKFYQAMKTSSSSDDVSIIRKRAEKLSEMQVYEIILPDTKSKLLEKIALVRKVNVEDILLQIIEQWTDEYERGVHQLDLR